MLNHHVVQRTKDVGSLKKAFDRLGVYSVVTSMPSLEYGEQLNQKIEAAKTPEARQQIITEIMSAYGIGGSLTEPMEYSSKVIDDEGITAPNKRPELGPELFNLSKGILAHLRMAITLNHENLHRQQYKEIGETNIEYAPEAKTAQAQTIYMAAHKEQMLREALAYESELTTIEVFRATFYSDEEPPEEIESKLQEYTLAAEQERDDHLNKLSVEEQNLFNEGKYAELLAQIRHPVLDGAIRHAASETYWEDFITATAMLYKAKDIGKRLQGRNSRYLRDSWKQIDRGLERRFYESRLSHWWLLSSPSEIQNLDIRLEIEKMFKQEKLARPAGFWNNVAENSWVKRD